MQVWQSAGLVVLAMVLIVGGDMAARILTQAGWSASFVAWARFGLAAVVLWPLSGWQQGDARRMLDWRLLLRAALIAAGITCILTALRTEPVANVFGGFFVGPVVSYVLATLLLGERFSVPRAALLAVSFAGVMIVVQPRVQISSGMVFAVTAGVFHGGYLVATRWLAGAYRPRFLLWSQLAIGTVILLPFALGPVPPMTAGVAGLLGISALGSAMGNLLLVLVNRSTPASVIAPLIYSQIIIGAVLGWAIFAEIPDRQTLQGLAVVIVAGVASVLVAGRGR